MIPETLDGWTLDVVRALVEQGVFESDRFDFKETLPHKRDEAGKLRLRKACASFANSDGGYLIVGVKDDKGLDPCARLVGLEPTDDFPEQFGNYPAIAEPSVEWAFLNPALRLGSGRLVHVVHIPASRRKPHAVSDDGRWWFCKRTSKGTEVMSYAEIQEAFIAKNAKLGRLKFLIAEVEHLQTVARGMASCARHAGLGGWRGSIPIVEFAAATAQLPDVFEFIAADNALVQALQNLRDAVMRVDGIRSESWRNNERGLAHHMGLAAEAILHATDHALPRLKAAVEHAAE